METVVVAVVVTVIRLIVVAVRRTHIRCVIVERPATQHAATRPLPPGIVFATSHLGRLHRTTIVVANGSCIVAELKH
jgi:hypothetical protein